MRLDVLDHGHRPRARRFLGVMETFGRRQADDVVKTILYRPELFGRAFVPVLRDVLRGPSAWTVGERELMAAVVSRANACTFCAGIHSYVATLRLDAAIPVAALDDWRALDLSPEVRATLEVLVRLTESPEQVSATDIDHLRAAGVSDDAIVDALHVAFVFNLVNRLANAFGYAFESDDARKADAKVLHRLGYRVPGFLLR